ncbi:hypothetical protein LTR08_000535 [Meristemomyces frigidus]|nr:hypothetical protein LTR08_000535 [Meristemomyces frigidus]
MSVAAHTPDAMYTELAFHGLGGYICQGDEFKSNTLAHGVTLHEVQQYADAQPELIAFEDEHPGYGSSAQEGYHPMEIDEDNQHDKPGEPYQQALDVLPIGSPKEEASPILRQRRTLSTRAGFEGPNAWDERMEHVGRHMEAAKKDGEAAADPREWLTDDTTEEWLIREELVARVGGRLVLVDLK